MELGISIQWIYSLRGAEKVCENKMKSGHLFIADINMIYVMNMITWKEVCYIIISEKEMGKKCARLFGH